MNSSEIIKAIERNDYDDAMAMILMVSSKASKESITGPEATMKVLLPWCGKPQEHFIVCHLDGTHKVTYAEVVTIGISNRTLVHPREIFRSAIMRNDSAIIIAHNHPSGNLDPSPEDFNVTKQVVEAGKIIGIVVVDHLIIGMKEGIPAYYSMLEQGVL